MRIVLTGSSGRVGRAIFAALAGGHDVVGIDRSPFSTTHLVGDVADEALLQRALEGADAVIHAAALHAPHVGIVGDDAFRRVNVEGTRLVAEAALRAGVPRLLFTSTTALYGGALGDEGCVWIDENTPPRPRSIYHRTKIEAELLLETMADAGLAVRILRMSRSFPEPADAMAAYRLHRGVDIRDVADAHVAALTDGAAAFRRHVISAATPSGSRIATRSPPTRPPSSRRGRLTSPRHSRSGDGRCRAASTASMPPAWRRTNSAGRRASALPK